MDAVIRVQILDEAVCILYSAMILLGKVSLSLSIVGQNWLFSLGIATGLVGKLLIQNLLNST